MKGVYIDEGFIVFRCGGYDYNIPMEKLDTPERILAWTVFLAQNHWTTKEAIAEFVVLALGKYPTI